MMATVLQWEYDATFVLDLYVDPQHTTLPIQTSLALTFSLLNHSLVRCSFFLCDFLSSATRYLMSIKFQQV